MPDGAKRIYRRRNEQGGTETYPIGSPSLLDKMKGLGAYAYSRHTREPVTYHEGKISMLEPESTKGLHMGLKQLPDWTHTIDVDVTYDNPHDTMAHEQMHHAFDPLKYGNDEQHGYIEGMMSPDERVQDIARGMVPADADTGLLDKLIQSLRRRPGNTDERMYTRKR